MKERCCCKGFLCGSVKSFAQVPWECVQLLFIGSTWLIAKYLAFEGMTRRSQDASPDELRKVLRIHVPNSLIGLAKAGKPSHAVSKAKAKAKGKAKAKAKAKASSSASAKAVAKSKAKAKAKAKASAKAAVVKNDDCVFERYYYTKSGACGIRQKLPERYQMFQFGNSSVTKSDLYEIADQCIQRMLANDLAKEDAKDWCTQRFHSLNQG